MDKQTQHSGTNKQPVVVASAFVSRMPCLTHFVFVCNIARLDKYILRCRCFSSMNGLEAIDEML